MKYAFSTVLTLLFIALKLTGHIDWSWFWVVSPIWISILLLFCVIAGLYGIFLFGENKT